MMPLETQSRTEDFFLLFYYYLTEQKTLIYFVSIESTYYNI